MGNKPKPSQPQRSQIALDNRVAVVWCEDYDSFGKYDVIYQHRRGK